VSGTRRGADDLPPGGGFFIFPNPTTGAER
jgi:hypothetical protein